MRGGHRPPAGAAPVWVVDPAAGRGDIPMLCAQLADLLRPYRRRGAEVICDVSRIAEPTMVTVETLARLRLTARRFGAGIRVRGAHPRLSQLLALAGLSATIPVEDGSAGEPHREAEQRKQPLDVQEVGDPPDPVA